MADKPRILVILGPTASGKSGLAVKLAKKCHGEVISADSRQVYKGLNIGTGKITKKEMQGVPHHLLDVAWHQKTFSVDQFKTLAEKAIEKILAKGKLPIICGGTGFYIQALVDNFILPEVPPDPKLRKKLEKKKTHELFNVLAKLDIRRAATIDLKNPARLVRAIEIATHLGFVPDLKKEPQYKALQIGIKTDDKILKAKIHKRLLSRIKLGMINEAKRLHARGLSWKRMEELGLEYRYLGRFLQKKKPFDSAQGLKKMLEQLEREIWHYAKRQKTWFKKDKRIQWLKVNEFDTATNKINRFLR